MIVANKRSICNFNLIIENHVIESVDKIENLGIIIDNNLIFVSHIEYICKQIHKKIAKLTIINFYNVIVKPQF